MSHAVVIGAGVSGLTTAVCLAERGCEVEVWTRDEPRHTTSMVAGALWGPSFLEPTGSTLRWCEASLREFRAERGRLTPRALAGGVAAVCDR